MSGRDVPRLKLDGKIIRDVSRSFYLTLRLLPAEVREVISLGYLLARVSDTIADTSTISTAGREETLQLYIQDVQSAKVSDSLRASVQQYFLNQEHEGERILMHMLPEILPSLSLFSSHEQELMRKVIMTITEGQLWDLKYFKEQRAVRDAESLERYTYQVAGCVGEFWTEVLALNGYLREQDLPEMKHLGIHYGKGLQLTNILRDIPEDFSMGRIYVPSDAQSVEQVITASSPWLKQAEKYLEAGLEYAARVPTERLRIATGLPAQLGLKTLSLLARCSVEERCQKVKISRPEVFKEILKMLFLSPGG